MIVAMTVQRLLELGDKFLDVKIPDADGTPSLASAHGPGNGPVSGLEF
jgi:hypothetical protein